MTLAFEKFMRQYESTGPEKADGYSQDVFLGLDENEKKKAFELLVTELPWGIEWLFFLEPQKALAVAKDREAKLRGKPYADTYMLQQQIVKYSGDLRYQQHMIDDYPGYSENVRPLVVDAIHSTPQNENTMAFFKSVILTEVSGSAVARASRHLLDALRVPQVTPAEKENYRALVAELRSDDTQRKLRTIAKLERKYVT
ncbi:hypothetical protein ACL58G_23645 [Massilia sp. GER05]|uniref:hypothetical protein n=1 Tax=unclassified Massilia TaxID=2609279 RepID=UPI0039B08901